MAPDENPPRVGCVLMLLLGEVLGADVGVVLVGVVVVGLFAPKPVFPM